jgi:phenylpropionate dioxygenase-like ring-hydroxylating dioxygenase large terminal subunit
MTAIETRPRSRGISYRELLDTDTHAVPDVLRAEASLTDAPVFVDVARYTSRAYHELEKERLWKRVWQMACREEDIPRPGDYLVYDIAGISVLVARGENGDIHAFHNVCLHRGRRLKDHGGCDGELRCSFHGFAWNLDGSLKHVPCGWDFPQVQPSEFGLPPVRVGTWGGFVFVNLDPSCGPLDGHLGELPQHFTRWPLEQRYKQAHVAKMLRCNWKLAQEAFMEAYHVVATHPQLLPGIGDANSQYDAWATFSRAITPNGTPSPHLKWAPTEQDMADAMTDRNLDEPPVVVVPEGRTAREVVGHLRREAMRPVLGADADALCDAELLDSFYYTLFPNLHPWGAYNRIVYRFRPYGDDHTQSIMECMYLAPFTGERPAAAPIHWLGPDDDWTEAPELGMLARVFNQDVFNLPNVQAGLMSGSLDRVTFASYQETKLRHFHGLLGRWVGDL